MQYNTLQYRFTLQYSFQSDIYLYSCLHIFMSLFMSLYIFITIIPNVILLRFNRRSEIKENAYSRMTEIKRRMLRLTMSEQKHY